MSRFSTTYETTSQRSIPFALFAAFVLTAPLSSARADITPTGDVSPSNPSAWTSSTDGYIGNTASGTLTVNGGSDILSSYGYIGYGSAATGVVSVSGTGSTWTNSSEVNVGYHGSGTLSITNGGTINSGDACVGRLSGSMGMVTLDGMGSTWIDSYYLCVGGYYGTGTGTVSIANGGSVSVAAETYIGWTTGSTGVIQFGANGGTLTTRSLLMSPTQLTGTGTINTCGLVSDIDLRFDSTHGLKRTFALQNSGQNITVNLDMTISQARDASLGAGWHGAGSLTICDGISVKSDYGYIGYESDSKGVATVSGTGSTWTNSGCLIVGDQGGGILSITSGAQVSGAGFIGDGPGSTGAVTLDGVGSMWTSGDRLDVGSFGSGALSISNHGSVSSGEGYVGDMSGSKGTVTVTGNGSAWTSTNLYVGNYGSGTLSMINRGAVTCNNGSIGDKSRSIGMVRVDRGSTWTNNDALYVGNSGSGTLSIANSGGTVISLSNAYIGNYWGSSGVVTVNGGGSMWIIGGNLDVGNFGSGTLSITGGGTVMTTSVSINSASLLAIDVDRDSSLNAGTITNNGKIRILAGAGIAADVYVPMSADTWAGFGTYQSIGGTWDAGSQTFTASSVASGNSGSAVPLNLALVQRALIDDNGPGGTNWQVGASFPAAGSTTNITFTATAVNDTVLNLLRSQLSPRESVLSGWAFSADGYAVSPSNPAYLSFNVGPGQSSDGLEVWHYDGSSWTSYSPLDLTYDGTFASFTATGFSGYAMVAVPEPGTLALLAGCVLGLAVYSRRRIRIL